MLRQLSDRPQTHNRPNRHDSKPNKQPNQPQHPKKTTTNTPPTDDRQSKTNREQGQDETVTAIACSHFVPSHMEKIKKNVQHATSLRRQPKNKNKKIRKTVRSEFALHAITRARTFRAVHALDCIMRPVCDTHLHAHAQTSQHESTHRISAGAHPCISGATSARPARSRKQHAGKA